MEMKLTIRRVPTVVSNYQDDADKPRAGCGRNCLGDCCLPVSKLPLYAFKADPAKHSQEDAASTKSLINILLTEWEDRMARGLFRYDVTACETKVIPGNLGFVAQLNEGRHLKKRPTEFRVDRVLQPFDPAKFNFTKVGQEEVLFQFENGAGDDSYFLNSASVTAVDRAPNVSPIEYGHVLLIPRVLDRLPQRIDPESFLLALQMAAEAASPYFRLGYNSLGAFATINHLHFQAYYLTVPFPVEKAATHKIPLSEDTMKSGVTVSKLLNYPVRGLVFEGGNTLNDLANVVSSACIWLQDNNVPYNVLISDCGKKIFLFPQCYAEKQALGEVSQELLDTQVNPAVWEISGHIVLKRRNDYEEASETSAWKLLAEVSLSEERFEEVKAYIFTAAGLVQADEEEVSEGKDVTYAPIPVAPLPVAEGCLVLQ
ncbi:GDP-L-galactose phosphorylase 2 [Dichanthelium oligosanthes]|uniref:GDP-D-glucose phosphorylase 1 n=1 Tax=Dichanthelium oligosanthes TaxID=888268 RepID=A0A1E5ULT1_9POAL|nr:GDP-L-galactose phosphorylase 2 [Dichanthelium oligosanthes]